MLKLILCITLIINIYSIDEYTNNSKLNFECSSQGTIVHFKPMRQFTLFLEKNLEKNQNVNIVVNKTVKCNLKNINSICTLVDLVRSVNITCEKPQIIKISVEKSQILQEGERINSVKLVQVDFGLEQRGQINILIDRYLAEKLKTMNASSDFDKQLFRFSDCVQYIALFENMFKIAIKKTQNQCVVGLQNFTTNWQYKKGTNTIQIGSNIYHDYLGANETIIYQVKQHKKYTMQVLILNDNERQLDTLEFIVTFINKTGGENSYKLINFQKGLQIFQSQILYVNQVSQLKLSSNINIFFQFSFDHSLQQIITLQKDQYFYTTLTSTNNYSVSLLLELQEFYEQKSKPKKVLIKKFEKELKLNYSFAQCTDQLCQKYSSFKPIKQQFTPQCQTLFNDVCIIKLMLQADHNELIGILPYVPIQNYQLQLNKLRKGVLRQSEIEHFVVPKSYLENIEDEINIEVLGANAFLTYQKDCKRISCCQFRDLSGFISIPNNQKDLYIILKGTKITHYTLLINTKQNKQFILQNGIIHKSQLQSYQDRKYYTFKVNNISKNIQINCNAAHNSLILLVNTKNKSFPTPQNYTYISKDCYIKISSTQLSKSQNIHITLMRANYNQQSAIPFNLLGFQQNSPIFLPQNIAFYDYYEKGAKKTFEYIISRQKYQTTQAFFKLDITENNVDNFVLMYIGTQTSQQLLIYNESTTKTIQFTPQILSKICSKQIDTCKIFIKVENIGKTSLDIAVMIWLKDQAIALTDGYYIHSQTGLLGDQSHFYIQVKNTSKPINIYIYSNQIQLETITRLWKPTDNSQIPYPSFLSIDKQKLDKVSYSFTSSIYYGTQQLKELGEEGGLILITLRDRSNQSSINKLSKGNFNNGVIRLVYTTGSIEIHQEDKLQFELKKNESLKVSFNIKNLILSLNDDSSHELYLHLTYLVGSATIRTYLAADTYKDTENVYKNAEFLFLNLVQLKKKLGKMTDKQQAYLIFTIESDQDIGRFLITIVSTNSDYRQLTLGVPEQFYIKKNSSIVFQFINFYNQDFKIKLNRKQGFPQYKIRSCNIKQDQSKCINQLKNRRAQDDPNNLIVSGRAHQLQITKQSQHYCKSCRYYFAFYAFNQQLSGSITITRSGLSTLLLQGKSIINEVYEKEIDEYRFKTSANKIIQIIVIPYMGEIEVSVYSEKLVNGMIKKSTSSQKGQNINIQLPQFGYPQEVIIKVNSKDAESSLYSIMFKSALSPIQVSDGMPMRFQIKNATKTIFSYLCSINSRLIIKSNVTIDSYITCAVDSKINAIQNKSIKSDKINLILKKDECSKFKIVIQNDSPADFILLVNGEDIIFLPFNTLIPSSVSESKSQIYQIPIQQKVYLKIVLQVCESGNGIIGLANSKSDLISKDYQTKFQLTHDKFHYVFEHTAKPGFLYIQIFAKINRIQYSIQVFPFAAHDALQNQITYLADQFIQPLFLRETSNNTNQFQLSFSPLVIEYSTNTNYTIDYVIIQSNKRNLIKKIIRCRGQYMVQGILPNQIINQYRITSFEMSNKNTIICKFQTKLKLSYISIIAFPTPRLPPYVIHQEYQIIEISSPNANLLQRFVKNLLTGLQSITHIQDQSTIEILLIVIVVFLNLCFILLSCYCCSKYCRSTIEIERLPLSTRDRFSGPLNSNSLDMIEKEQRKQSQLDLFNKRQGQQKIIKIVQKN